MKTSSGGISRTSIEFLNDVVENADESYNFEGTSRQWAEVADVDVGLPAVTRRIRGLRDAGFVEKTGYTSDGATTYTVDCTPDDVARVLGETRPGAVHIRTTVQGYVVAYASFKGGGLVNVGIHRLVAVAEYGFDAVSGKHIHHKTGIPWDNRPENLSPETQSEHMREHWHSSVDDIAHMSREKLADLFEEHGRAGIAQDIRR
ncbi:hypothetical protein DMJ13_27385 [halophilic archaeon]|nr:hypothetical protein DMJ13_27385 [halophilic archaeon]